MSLAELNTARRTARDLGIEGASKMKLAEVKAAIEKHYADERDFAAAMTEEENAQDTPAAAAAYERAMTPPAEDFIGSCVGCGETVSTADEGVTVDDEGIACFDCKVQPMSGIAGVEEKMTPRADCADPDCAAAASVPVETRTDAQKTVIERDHVIALDHEANRAVIDVRRNGQPFRHLAIPGIKVSACMKTHPLGTLGLGSLDSVDCLDCVDEFVRLATRKA